MSSQIARTILPSLAAIISALTLAVTLPATARAAPPTAGAEVQVKTVYHINDSSRARMVMRNMESHLNADPKAKLVLVSHANGIDFLLDGAKDDKGKYAPQVAGLVERGVDFRVCRNTLAGRNLSDDAVTMEASVVPSGVAEIGRLQSREGYGYLKP